MNCEYFAVTERLCVDAKSCIKYQTKCKTIDINRPITKFNRLDHPLHINMSYRFLRRLSNKFTRCQPLLFWRQLLSPSPDGESGTFCLPCTDNRDCHSDSSGHSSHSAVRSWRSTVFFLTASHSCLLTYLECFHFSDTDRTGDSVENKTTIL